MDDDLVSRADERRFLKRLEEAALHEHPNPDRVGCPGSDFLKQLAYDHRSVALDDPRIDHIGQCSPCFREFQKFRTSRRRRRRLMVATPIAAGVIAVALLLVQNRPGAPLPQRPAPATQVAQAIPATLDFRPFSTTRDSDRSQTRADVPSVARGVLDTRVILPVGTDAGTYELRIMDREDFRIFLRQNVAAEITDGVTAINTRLDLRELSPGRYLLGIRIAGGDWRTFPVVVR